MFRWDDKLPVLLDVYTVTWLQLGSEKTIPLKWNVIQTIGSVNFNDRTLTSFLAMNRQKENQGCMKSEHQ